MDSKVNDSQTATHFGLAHHMPRCQGVAFVALVSFFGPKAFPSNLVQQLNDFGWQAQSAKCEDD